MPYIVYVIQSPDSIAQLKDQVALGATKREESATAAGNYLKALNAGMKTGTVQLTVRDTDPSVATSGTGSVQETYNFS